MYRNESVRVKCVPGKEYFPTRGFFDKQGFSGLVVTVITRAFKVFHQERRRRPFSKEVAYLSALADRIRGGKPRGWTRMYAGLWRRSKSCVHQWVKRYRSDAEIQCFEDQLRRTDAWVERYAGRIPTSVFEEKVDGVVAELAAWMLRTMNQNSQRRRWRGVLAGLVKKMWTVTKDLFLLTTGALSKEKEEHPERRDFEITVKGVREIDRMIARWVRSPEILHARPRYRFVRMLRGEPLYALTDKGRKAYYSSRDHGKATRGGHRQAEPEPTQPPSPTAPEDSPFGPWTSQIVRAMGGTSREERPARQAHTLRAATGQTNTQEAQGTFAKYQGTESDNRPVDRQLQKRQAESSESATVMTEPEAKAALAIMPPGFAIAQVDGGYSVRRAAVMSA